MRELRKLSAAGIKSQQADPTRTDPERSTHSLRQLVTADARLQRVARVTFFQVTLVERSKKGAAGGFRFGFDVTPDGDP